MARNTLGNNNTITTLKPLLILLAVASTMALHAQPRIVIKPAPDKAAMTLGWDHSPEYPATVTNYIIYYGSNGPGYYTVAMGAGTNTSITVSNLTRNVTNWFVATAVSRDGLESDPSNEVFYKAPPKPRPVVMDNPTNLYVGLKLEGAPAVDGPWRDLWTPEPFAVENDETASFYKARLEMSMPVNVVNATRQPSAVPIVPLLPPMPR